jgi:hypothetical protein
MEELGIEESAELATELINDLLEKYIDANGNAEIISADLLKASAAILVKLGGTLDQFLLGSELAFNAAKQFSEKLEERVN